MNSPWLLPTPILDDRGRATDERTQVEVDASPFRAGGWRHVVRDHLDHPGWAEILPEPASVERLCEAERSGRRFDGKAPEDELVDALRAALERSIGRPHFVVQREDGYSVLPAEFGTTRGIFDGPPVERREGLVAVDRTGLVIVVRDRRLATAYFPDTASRRVEVRFREASLLVRRKANLAAYHDPKSCRYWRRVTPPAFHDRTTWASPVAGGRRA